MAQRRMFSKKITNSGRFLQMSQSAQALYFHLGLDADDDGVVEAYSIMRLLGAAEDDFKVLVAKGFIRPLNDDLVSFILDWNEHNLIRPDRKVDSIYKELLMRLVPEVELTQPRPRADTGALPRGNTTGRPVDNQWTAQVRLGKDSIGKDNKTKEPQPVASKDAPMIVEVIDAFAPVNTAYQKWFARRPQRDAASRLIATHGLEQVKRVIKQLPVSNTTPYFPTITTPIELEDRWAKLEAAWLRKKNDSGNKTAKVAF